LGNGKLAAEIPARLIESTILNSIYEMLLWQAIEEMTREDRDIPTQNRLGRMRLPS